MIEEAQIISLLRNRDPKGLSILYEQYGATIFGVINRIVSDSRISEEILQQTFLKAWNKFDSYNESKSALYTWLSAIARNTAIDKLRLKSFQQHQKSESLESNVHVGDSSITNLSGIDTKNLLKKLDDKYRIVLDMMYLQGYSQSEISEELGIPLGTIKTRVRKAILFLRQELKNEKGLFLGVIFILTLILLLCH